MDDPVAGEDVKAGDVRAASSWLDGDVLGVPHSGDLLAAGRHQRVATGSHVLALQQKRDVIAKTYSIKWDQA